MPSGRPSKNERTDFGQRLHDLRCKRGLSQMQVADQLEISQQTYAGWERSTTALRPSAIACLADFLGVTSDELLGRKAPAKRGTGPKGRAQRVFEEVSTLPRRQQTKILDTVETLLAGHLAKSSD